MAYDAELAARVRDQLLGTDVRERAMFGGLAFLVGGHLAVAAGRRGALMVRCDPDATEELASRAGAAPMVMRGSELRGWLEVDAEALADDGVLAGWVEVGRAYAASLPPKPASCRPAD